MTELALPAQEPKIAALMAGVDFTTYPRDPWNDPTEAQPTCAGDPEEWFPEKGQSTKVAKRFCGDCPFRADCLLTALVGEERHGVWGGASERERRVIGKIPHVQAAVKVLKEKAPPKRRRRASPSRLLQAVA
ncbi:WhiB family transcriptional regulator [Actinopolymorpha sp. B17G11]|uniref:WhiB family transcriptional regulator n=1 Tax=Actinopolymorpha sp. B17G11 TaxID=3160861 RepID=UPI0032E4CE90